MLTLEDASDYINAEWAACYERPVIKDEAGNVFDQDPIRYACGRARGLVMSVTTMPMGTEVNMLSSRLKFHQSLLAGMIDHSPVWCRTAYDYYERVIKTLDADSVINHTTQCRKVDHDALAAQAAMYCHTLDTNNVNVVKL